MSERRFAIVGPSWPFKGGIARYTTDLYRALSAHRETLFISVSRQYPRWLYPGRGDQAPEDRTTFEPAAQPLLDPINPASWWRSARALAAFAPATVLLPWWHPFWGPAFATLATLIRRRSPELRIVFLCHNVIGHEGGLLARTVSRYVLSHGDAFFVHGENEEQELLKLLGDVPCTRIEHPAYGINTAVLPSKRDARRRLALDSDCPVLLFFGFVRPYKGLELLLEAVAMVRQSLPCCLLVAGEVWGMRKALEKRIRELGIDDRVRFHDRYIPEKEVGIFFSACDAVVLPYRSATGSGVTKLALSHGRAVIATRVGSLASVIEDGVNGYAVPAGDAAALAAAIHNILVGNRAAMLGLAAAASARRHGWQPIITALEAL